MKNLIFLIIALFFISCQQNVQDVQDQISVDDDFPSIKKSPAHKVLTLGVFHFDRSRDGSDVVASNHIDITSPKNQTQLNQLVEVLKEFNPAKIAVEWRPEYQTTMDSLYQAYRNGTYQLEKNEAFQIGFRVADLLDHAKVYCVDNNPPMPDNINAIDDWDSYAESLGHTKLWHAYDEENERYNTYMDTIQRHVDVLDYLKIMNSPNNIRRSKQLWTTGLVNVGYGDQYLGADLLGRWYRRNVRIFVNAKNLVQADQENLLIIYGGAHKWILDELFEASPDFEVVQLLDMIQ